MGPVMGLVMKAVTNTFVRSWTFAIAFALDLTLSCGPYTEPNHITPRPAPPDPTGYTCETVIANLKKLGGCGVDIATFVDGCHAAQDAEHQVGVALPVGCMSVAGSCVDAKACR